MMNKKDDLTCPFHGDFEKRVGRVEYRTFWILVMLAANLLAQGVKLISLIPVFR